MFHKLYAVIFVVLVSSAESGAFLKPGSEIGVVDRAEVEQALLFQLFADDKHARIRTFEVELLPLFEAMPKNVDGLLEPSVMRYALHRYFVHKWGWHVSGLERRTATQNSSSPAFILKDRLPVFIESFLFNRLHRQGLDLHELAAFVVVLSDLVSSEYTDNLQKVFQKLGVDMSASFSALEVDDIMESYLIHYFSLMNPRTTAGNSNMSFGQIEVSLDDEFVSWREVQTWAKDLRRTLKFSKVTQRNPFAQEATYSDVEEFALELGHRFGKFQGLECHSLKEHLMDLEYRGTGRVRLAEFYSSGSDSKWDLTESVDYLRALGALDESDPTKPSVIIPNFVGSRTNCVYPSSLYTVCCMDECESLMSSLERVIGGPHASPASVVAVVSTLPSETVVAPRNISVPLLQRLDEIASFHDGEVPVHGRLFAQWMHHAYPRECSYPHASGTTNPLSPDEWRAKGGDTEADREVMASYTIDTTDYHDLVADMSPEAKMELMPWIGVEELAVSPRPASQGASFRSGCQLIGVVAFAASLLKLAFSSSSWSSSPAGRHEKQLV